MTRLSLEAYVTGVEAADRGVVARAITLVESARDDDRALAAALLEALSARIGGAIRIGVSGLPGAGKSTFIDALGSEWTARGHRVAVVAVDPSSAISGGCILGDKTRMSRLGRDPHAFVRPSPSGGTLGGIARRTREATLVLEAAGYDVVLVETVGVGQSEAVVAEMVDLFLLLTISGGGDELQGIKRGVLELADAVLVNKADGEGRDRALRTAQELEAAMRLLRGGSMPLVRAMSSLEGESVAGVAAALRERHDALVASGELERRRAAQRARWMWSEVEETLLESLRRSSVVAEVAASLEPRVRTGELSASRAAREILAAFEHNSP